MICRHELIQVKYSMGFSNRIGCIDAAYFMLFILGSDRDPYGREKAIFSLI